MFHLYYPCAENAKIKKVLLGTTLRRLVLTAAAVACTLPLVGNAQAAEPKTGGKDGLVPKFWVPKKVGDVREITFTNNMFDKFDDTLAGNKTSSSNTTLQVFQGKIKTLAVDDSGRETLVEVTVNSFKDTYNGAQNTLLEAGKMMVVEAKANVIEVRFKNGDVYNDMIGAQLMRMAVNMPVRDSLPDDVMRVFGTKQAKKVGDTWAADKDLLVSWINKSRTDKLPPEALAGTAKFVGTGKEGGVNYADLEVTITQTFKNFTETTFTVAGAKKPANLKVNGEIKIVYTFRFPADFSTGPFKSSWKNNTNQRHEGTIDGQNATMLTEIRDSWTETAKYTSGGAKGPPDKKDPVKEDPPVKENPQGGKGGVPVKFWVPKKVGDVRDITFTNNMFDKFDDTVAGNKTSASNTTLQVFQGKIKTLAVDNLGRETKAELTIVSCTDTYNGAQTTLLNAGAVMIVEAKADVVEVRDKGGEVYGDNIGVAFVRKAVNMPLPNQLADDAVRIFPTNELKKVGDAWTGDKDVLVSIINGPRFDKLPPEAVAAKAKVVGLVKEGGVSYVDLEVTITQTFKNFTETRFNKQPANFKVNGEIVTILSYRFPADYSTGPVKSGWKSTTNQRHEGTLNGQNATMLTEIRDSWSETAKYSSNGNN